MGIERTPNYIAGNRYGLNGTITIPELNGWNAIAEAIHTSKGLDFFNKDI